MHLSFIHLFTLRYPSSTHFSIMSLSSILHPPITASIYLPSFLHPFIHNSQWTIFGPWLELVSPSSIEKSHVIRGFQQLPGNISSYIQASSPASQFDSCEDAISQNLVYRGMTCLTLGVQWWCQLSEYFVLLLSNLLFSLYFSHLEGGIIRPSARKHCFQEGTEYRPGIHAW